MAIADLARVSENRKLSLNELRESIPLFLAMYGEDESRTEQIATAIYYFNASVELTRGVVLFEGQVFQNGEFEPQPALCVRNLLVGA